MEKQGGKIGKFKQRKKVENLKNLMEKYGGKILKKGKANEKNNVVKLENFDGYWKILKI